MPLRPHQFRYLKESFNSLGEHLKSLEDTISRCGEAISGIRDEKKTDKEIQQEISRQIPLLSIPKKEREEANANQERRHRENRGVQRWIAGGTLFTGICTFFAFGAAAYYAHQAARQSKIMDKTYGEIQKQTKAAECAARAAQSEATTASDAFNESKNEFSKTLGQIKNQIATAQGANKIAQQALVAQTRPWITIQNLSIGKEIGDQGQQTIHVIGDKMVIVWNYQFELVNFGRLPAKVEINDKIITGIGGINNLKDFPCTPTDNRAEGDVVFPGTPLKKHRSAGTNELAKWAYGLRNLYVCITYSELGVAGSRTYHTKLRYLGVTSGQPPVQVDGIGYYPVDLLELQQTIAE